MNSETDKIICHTASGEARVFYLTKTEKPEFLLISGKSGDETRADSEALGRIVNLCLEHGVSKRIIAKTLQGIDGGMYGTYQGKPINSKATLIAVAMSEESVIEGKV